jgi:hypothetical protein
MAAINSIGVKVRRRDQAFARTTWVVPAPCPDIAAAQQEEPQMSTRMDPRSSDPTAGRWWAWRVPR